MLQDKGNHKKLELGENRRVMDVKKEKGTAALAPASFMERDTQMWSEALEV